MGTHIIMEQNFVSTELVADAIRSARLQSPGLCIVEDRLDDTDKSLILLYLDNIPSRQIAIITGVGEATARKRIERIKQKLIKLNEQDNGSIF